ncbi:hypothetical protein Tco_0708797, partial [Tanacetum coccineum]
MSMTIQSGVKDKILATSSETPKVENAPAEMLCDMDQQMEKRADDGKANVVTDALSRKERGEAFNQENVLAERLHGLDQQMERKGDRSLYFMDRIWVPLVGGVRRILVGSVMDEAHASSKEWNSGDNQLRLRWMIYLVVLADAVENVRDTIRFDGCYHLSIQCDPFEALYGKKCRLPVLWAEIRESSLIKPEL